MLTLHRACDCRSVSLFCGAGKSQIQTELGSHLSRWVLSFALTAGLMSPGRATATRLSSVQRHPAVPQILTHPSPLSLCPPSFLPAVPYQQNPYTAGSGSSVIQCYRCGDTCKGEVVRVQSNHFHIRCFTCQGRIRMPKKLAPACPTALGAKQKAGDTPIRPTEVWSHT